MVRDDHVDGFVEQLSPVMYFEQERPVVSHVNNKSSRHQQHHLNLNYCVKLELNYKCRKQQPAQEENGVEQQRGILGWVEAFENGSEFSSEGERDVLLGSYQNIVLPIVVNLHVLFFHQCLPIGDQENRSHNWQQQDNCYHYECISKSHNFINRPPFGWLGGDDVDLGGDAQFDVSLQEESDEAIPEDGEVEIVVEVVEPLYSWM